MKAIAALLLVSSLAYADKADDLFKAGKKLMAEKKYAEACKKFEDSYKQDPAIGTELNVGRCYEEWGKLGKAYRAYKVALKQAKDANDDRVSKITALIDKLEPNVPKILIHVPEGAETKNLQVTIDGQAIDTDDLSSPQLVDPGPKQVEYALGSGTRKSKLVPVERGGTSEITLDLPKVKEKVADEKPIKKKPPEPEEPVETPSKVGHGQRVAGVVVASVGVVGIGVGSYLALAARSKYNDALSSHCMGMTNMCDAQGLTDTHDARSQANLASIVFGVGAAAAVTGIVIYVIAPKASTTEHALYVAPTSNGFAFGGRF
ncbi:MAG: tetratricopeptide repeat protein [Kofleriaceae bacterium]